MKNCWIICGPEGSGSVFIAKTISFATGHCEFFGQYSGSGRNSKTTCENLVLHRSVPYGRPKKFQNSLRNEIGKLSKHFDRINYVLTTRDKNCSTLSKLKRFKGSLEDADHDYWEALPFFQELATKDNCFIWNYETMVLLGAPYFIRMYRFFGIRSKYIPEVVDGNAKYFEKDESTRSASERS